MTDPHEIIEEALANAHDIDMTDALYAKAIVRKLEAAGYRLLSAEGVTDEMAMAARDEKRRGYDIHDDPDECPAIYGYEQLEREGIVERVGVVNAHGQERIHFRLIAPTPPPHLEPKG